MATVTKTFTFATDAEGFVATNGDPTSTTLSWSSTVGNPAGSLAADIQGRNKTSSNYWEWTGTWEALGVPAGSTVSSVRLLSASTRVSVMTHSKSTIVGPYALLDSSATQIGQLWAGRTTTVQESAWTATGAQTPISITSQSASNSTIKIRLADTVASGNSNSAETTANDDQVSIEITYTAPAAPIAISASDSGTFSVSSTSSVVPIVPPPVQLDPSSPAMAHADTSTSNTTITTASFTAPANSLLVAFVAGDNGLAGNTLNFTINDTGGLAWTAIGRRSVGTNIPAGTGVDGYVGLFAATTTAAAARTVTATASGNDTQAKMLVIKVFTDSSGAAPTIGQVVGTSSASGIPSATLTTSSDNSWVWGVCSDWTQQGAGTFPAGQTRTDLHDPSGLYTGRVWKQDAITATSGTSVTMNMSGPSAQKYNELAVEIKSASIAPFRVSSSDSGTFSVSSTATVVPTTPPAGISAPWVGTGMPGNTTALTGTSASVDVSGAPNGQVCFIIGTVSDAQTGPITAPSGWVEVGQTSEGTTGGSSTRTAIFYKVKGSGDTNVTISWPVSTRYEFNAISWAGVDSTTPVEGLSWATHTSGTSYATGASTPTAADRWAVGVFSVRGSTALLPWTPDAALTERVDITTTNSPYVGLEIADSGAPVTQASHTYTATGQTSSHGLGALFYLIPGSSAPPTPDTFVTGTDSGTFSVTGTASVQEVVITLPGFIGGVEPESHAHNPPLLAPNGNLYRITESDTASGNHPMAWKSSNGGATWVEMDSANRPTAQDMEGSWVAMDGTTLIFSVTRDDTVWWTTFDTTTDTWASQETIDSGLSSSGVEQYSSFVKNGDGTFWVFYSDTLSGTNQQIAYRKRSGANTYSAKSAIGPTTSSNIAPSPVKGASDVTHVFYKDDAANTIYWRTLTTAGVLSAATSVATGTATDNIPHTNAVYVDNAGTEEISVAYSDSSDILKLARVVNGVAQTPETISSVAITMDPGSVTNGGTVAHLASYNGVIYAIWSDSATGNVLMRSRALNGTWSSISTLWSDASLDAWYTFNNVYVRSGRIIMGYVYDRTHAVDVSDLWYNEVDLGPVSNTINISSSDSGTLSATETSSFGTVAFTRTDAGTFSATESSSSLITAIRADSGTISATEVSQSSSQLSRSDAGTISATDSSTLFLNASISDSGVLSATESSSLFVSDAKDLNDSSIMSVTESSSISGVGTISDAGTLSAADGSTLVKFIALNDSGTLSATETSVVFNDRPTTDSGTYSVSETSDVVIIGTVSKSAADVGTLSALEVSSLSVVLTRTDSGTHSTSETIASSGTTTASDTGTISMVESSSIFKTISVVDSGTHSTSETSVVFNNRPTTDAGTYSVSETSDISITGTITKSATDIGTQSVLESQSSISTISAGDSGGYDVSEESAGSSTGIAADTTTISVDEQSYLFLSGDIDDSGTHSVDELVSIETIAAPIGLSVKVWNGTAMVSGHAWLWNGAAFVEISTKVWNGTDWS